MKKILSIFAILLLPALTFASEADLVIPDGVKDKINSLLGIPNHICRFPIWILPICKG